MISWRIPKKNNRLVKRGKAKKRFVGRISSYSHNFSDVEDNANAFLTISELAVQAGNNAAAEAKAAGISRVYLRNDKDLVKVSASGEAVQIAPKIKRDSFYVKYPFTTLHAVKK